MLYCKSICLVIYSIFVVCKSAAAYANPIPHQFNLRACGVLFAFHPFGIYALTSCTNKKPLSYLVFKIG